MQLRRTWEFITEMIPVDRFAAQPPHGCVSVTDGGDAAFGPSGRP
jgi:hypothetical protein